MPLTSYHSYLFHLNYRRKFYDYLPHIHWICFNCLIEIQVTKYGSIGNQEIKCPLCRKSFNSSNVNWMQVDREALAKVEQDAKRRKYGSQICFSASDNEEWWEKHHGIIENGKSVTVQDIGYFLDYTLGNNYKSYKVKDDTLYNELKSMEGGGFIKNANKDKGKICATFEEWRL